MRPVFTLLDYAPWIAIGLVWLVGAALSKRSVRRESLRDAISYRVPLVLGALAIMAPRPTGHVRWLQSVVVARGSASHVLGFALSVAGAALAIWARATLGRLWSGSVTLKEGHRLVQSGPYRLARHPIYTGMLLALAGDTLIAGTLGALAGLVLVIAGLVVKTSIEERFLEDQFGQELRDYRARVKRLVPFVW
jgi:protein-S-isoprenylcysteine O-methyltransferase Ste14